MQWIKVMACAALVLASAEAAMAESWPGVDAARQPAGSRDVDFALGEVCYPYLLDNASLEAVSARPGYRVQKPSNSLNVGSVLTISIGGRDLSVLVEQVAGYRTCSVSINGGDNDVLHAAVLARLAEWPVGFVPARGGFSAGPPRVEELCGVSDVAPYDRVKFYEDSTAGHVRFTVTLTRDQSLWPFCR